MSDRAPKVVTGSENKHLATWKIGGVVTPISGTATIEFILTSHDHKTPYTSVLVANSTDDGADWPNGKIQLVFPSAATSSVTYQGAATVQVQVSDPAPVSAFYTVVVVRGNI